MEETYISFDTTTSQREQRCEVQQPKLKRLLTRIDRHVEPRRDDAGLVETPIELNHDFTAAVVIDDLELADVAYWRETND